RRCRRQDGLWTDLRRLPRERARRRTQGRRQGGVGAAHRRRQGRAPYERGEGQGCHAAESGQRIAHRRGHRRGDRLHARAAAVGGLLKGLFLLAMCAAIAACAPVHQRKDPPRVAQLVFPAPPDAPRFVYEWTLYSSADVVKDDRDTQLRRRITGEGRAATGFGKPYAVAVHQGRIFLSDSVERFVKVFAVPQGRYFQIGVEGAGRLAKPLGIDVDRAGSLYVADASLRAVLVYDRD